MAKIIKCCKDCKPPKRHPGCHSKCREYLTQKIEFEKDKIAIREDNKKNKEISYKELDMIGHKKR